MNKLIKVRIIKKWMGGKKGSKCIDEWMEKVNKFGKI